MKQILFFFSDQNTKSNVGKEVKHVEESQRNGHHLSDEQHQQQQRPNKQTTKIEGIGTAEGTPEAETEVT